MVKEATRISPALQTRRLHNPKSLKWTQHPTNRQRKHDDIPEEIMELDTDDILTRIRLIDNDIKVRFPLIAVEMR